MPTNQLLPNPTTLDFGTVTNTASFDIELFVTNDNDVDDITIVDVASSNGKFVIIGSLSHDIGPGVTESITVRYTPTTAVTDTGNVTVQSSASNSPLIVPYTGTGVASGSKRLSFNPSSWDFGEIKVGATSATKVFGIQNNGTVDVTVSNIVVDAPFTARSPLPSFPLVIAPTAIATFGVSFDPSTDGYILDGTGIHITSDAVGSPAVLALMGTGAAILPVFSLTGFVWTTLAAFTRLSLLGTTYIVVCRKFNPTNWDCEEEGSLVRWHDFGRAGVSKTYFQMALLHEDIGDALIDITISDHLATKSETGITLGDTNSDDLLLTSTRPLEVYAVSGVIKTTIARGELTGPVSLLAIIHTYDDEPRLGTVAQPATLTPVYSLTNVRSVLAGFGAVCRKFNPTNLNTEVAGSIVRDRNFGGPGYEDSLTRVQVNYEDWGVATITVTATTRRGHSDSQTLTIGTVAADRVIRQILADIDKVSEEVFTVTISRAAAAGPVVITSHDYRFASRGEVKKP